MSIATLLKHASKSALIIGALLVNPIYGQQKMQPDRHNFSAFSSIRQANKSELEKFSSAQSHPEYGILPFNAPCTDCIEIIEERTQYTRKYLRVGTNGKEFLLQQGYSPLHYQDNNGQWITYNPKLTTDIPGRFKTQTEFYEIIIDVNTGFISFENKAKGFRPLVFHQDLVLEKTDGQGNIVEVINSNWSNYSAGDEGVRITDIFPFVDLEILVYKDQIKTNFVVKQDIGSFQIKEAVNPDFTERLQIDANGSSALDFIENNTLSYQIGEIKIFGSNEKRNPIKGIYNLDGNQLIYSWVDQTISELEYPVIIDPTVSTTGTLPQGSILGAGDWSNAGSFTAGCTYNLSVATPANCQITDVQWSFVYVAQNGAVLADGACKFYYGGCVSPSTPGFFWYCNDPLFGGTCTGTNVSIFTDFQTCIPAPQCAPYNMNFTMEFFDYWGAFNAQNCDPTYVTAGSDWVMTIIGETLDQPAPPTSSAGTTICEGDNTTLTASGVYGVPGYTYSWDNGGGSGNPVVVSPTSTTTYTCTITDACGVTANNSITITVNPAPDPGTNNSISFCTSDPVTSLFGVLGGTPDGGGSWSGPSTLTGGSAGNFNPATMNAGVYTYTVTGTPPCTNASANVTVTITPAPNAGTNGSTSFCPTDPTADLFGFLGGSPDGGGTWSPAMASGTGVFNPALDPAGVYTYTVTNSCGSASANVTVTINPAPDAGTNGSTSFCPTDPSADLFGFLGGSPSGGGTWSPAMASGTGVFNPALDPAGVYTYTVTNSCGSASADVTVTINPAPNAGTNGSTSFCPTDPTADLFGFLGGSPDGGGTWSPAMASGTGVFNPALDPAGVYTYTVTNSCGSASADVTVTLNPAPNAGTNGSLAICLSDPSTDLFNELGGSPDGGGTWSPAMASGTGVFDPAVDPGGTYTYTVTNSCGSISADVTVTVISAPNAGTNGAISFCPTDPSSDLFNQLGGTPDGGGTWSPALTSGTGVFDPTVDPGGTYTYTVSASCGTSSADVVVTINPAPNAGTNGTLVICVSDPSTDLFNELGGSPDGGGIWSPAMTSGTGVFDPAVDASGTYTYTVTNSCGTISADVDVTVISAPNAGTNGAVSYCPGDPSSDLFNELGGTPDGGGTWSPALASGTGVFDPSVDPAGTYTYTVSASCGTSTADVVVTINPAPDAGSNGALTICATDPSTDLINQLGGTPDGGGTWSPALTSGTGVFDPAADPSGTYTYTVTNSCGTASADVVVTISANPDPGSNGTATFCSNDPTADLFGFLGGTPDGGGTWSPAMASGTGVFNPAIDPAGVYTYTLNDCGGGTVTATVTVTVNPAPNAGSNGSVTFCDTDPSADLFASLGGSPDPGGTWSPALSSGTGIFNPAIDPAGTYTYSVTNSCGSSSSTVTVTVNSCAPPVANFTASAMSICLGDCITFTDLSSGNPSSWFWEFDGAADPDTSIVQNPTLCPDSIGTFTITLTVTNTNGTDTYVDSISVYENPTVDAIGDTTINMNDDAFLTSLVSPTGGTYEWTGANDIECSNCNSVYVSPIFSTVYNLTYTTDNGCVASDSVLVNVNFQDLVDVPNGFSPNSDGNNDFLYVKGEGIVTMNFVIYNRYGQKVFETSDQSEGWDGNFKDVPENPGVFAWYLEYSLIDGTSNLIKGSVTLLK